MYRLNEHLDQHLGTSYTAAQVEIRLRGAVIYRAAVGTVAADGDVLAHSKPYPVRRDTLFDLASLTKIITATAFFRLTDSGRVRIDSPVSEILPEFSGWRPIAPYENPLNLGELITVQTPTPTPQLVNASEITFAQLLSHSSGLPAWVNLRAGASVAERQKMLLESTFAYTPNTQALYSDVGFMLLGLAIERLTDVPLAVAIKRLVIRPLELSATYGPIRPDETGLLNVAPTEFCPWRGRRLHGEVHDENAATLEGVAGHAGLFGTAADMAILGQIYLAKGGGFVPTRLAQEAVRRQIDDRGLGWMMRTPGKSSSGALFSADSYGHTGFVGNSLWVDPQRQLVVALLTNNVFFGRHRDEFFGFRIRFHDLVIECLEE
jgi:serine-type D-Ala-D-Ala carboxypeptidase